MLITPHDKLTILSLRSKGLTYGQISKRLSIPTDTVKSVCRREAEKKSRCRNCDRKLTQHREGRPRSFCSDNCRLVWWKTHRNQVNRKAYYRLTCANCGHQFESYGHKERKFCSHRCYINYRFPPRC